MGARGPVPKRSDERRRTNKPATPSGEITTAPAMSDVPVPEASPEWHPVAARLFEALKASGQARFYEPSDWAVAYLMAESMSLDLKPQFVGFAQTGRDQTEAEFAVIPLKGASLSAYLKALGSLLATEGDRRRASIELRRGQVVDADEDASVTALDEYRVNLGA
jgi:hypothetical protein